MTLEDVNISRQRSSVRQNWVRQQRRRGRTHAGEVRVGTEGTVLEDLTDGLLGKEILNLSALNLLNRCCALSGVSILVRLACRRWSRV